MKIISLGSGSSGNALLIEDGRSAIMVDAGFSVKQLCERLEQSDYAPSDIEAILVTHEHIDHIRGVGYFSRKFHIPICAPERTLKAGKSIIGNLAQVKCIDSATPFEIGDFHMRPFSVSHDAAEPVGYIVENGGVKIGICTDLGYVTRLVVERLRGCNTIVLETNHDPGMLMAGPYPWPLKQRIRSKVGHLSNEDACGLLRDIWHADLQYLMLAHLSKENNLPDLANLAIGGVLRELGGADSTVIRIAVQDKPSEMITISDIKTLF